MIDILKTNTKDRKLYINIIICFFVLLGIIIIPAFVNIYISKYITNSVLKSIISSFIYIIILVIIYYKDLKEEFCITKKEYKKHIKKCFKYYIIGLLLMMFFNSIINIIFCEISDNETVVRSMLYSSPVLLMINISIIAPIEEELVFRKSIKTVFNNRIVYALVSGLLFAFAHLMTNFITGTFVLKDLIYLLPYMSLGSSLALILYDTKSTFTSIIFHSIHNTFVGLLLLITYYMGVL